MTRIEVKNPKFILCSNNEVSNNYIYYITVIENGSYKLTLRKFGNAKEIPCPKLIHNFIDAAKQCVAKHYNKNNIPCIRYIISVLHKKFEPFSRTNLIQSLKVHNLNKFTVRILGR